MNGAFSEVFKSESSPVLLYVTYQKKKNKNKNKNKTKQNKGDIRDIWAHLLLRVYSTVLTDMNNDLLTPIQV